MKLNFASLLSGFIFSMGLGLSGMTLPKRIIGFLNLYNFNDWDPTLMFVMIGALAVNGTVYYFIKNKEKPLFDSKFSLPNVKEITRPLVLGSLIFGVGWGIGGICPGPALASLATGRSEFFVFAISMSLGMLLQNLWSQRKI